MRKENRNNDAFVMIWAACGILAPLLQTLKIIVLGALHPGYSHISQTVSELSVPGAPNAIASRVASIVVGLLIIAFAYGLHQSVNQGQGSPVGPIFLALFGLTAQVGTGLFPLDAVGQETLSGTMHSLMGNIGLVAIVITAFSLSNRLNADESWETIAGYSNITGFLVIILVVINIVAGSALENWAGALQRLLIGVIMVYIFVLAVKQLRLSRS